MQRGLVIGNERSEKEKVRETVFNGPKLPQLTSAQPGHFTLAKGVIHSISNEESVWRRGEAQVFQ